MAHFSIIIIASRKSQEIFKCYHDSEMKNEISFKFSHNTHKKELLTIFTRHKKIRSIKFSNPK